ncbi:MAG: hypothetical protein K2K81_07385 [Muribaculaceae bacterium]|nr:hypothetical protein [Muribaculaceae bacterium]
MEEREKSLHLGHVGLLAQGIRARAGEMEGVTWAQLKHMRDYNKLVAGRYYRITDYECTTVTEDTRAAQNHFDIIVLAVSPFQLSEEAMATWRDPIEDYEGTPLESANLKAWKLWYSLDNNTERFAWADPENGRGVIYRMIDEWGNDVPYDFKNIEFKRYRFVADGDFFQGSNLDGAYYGFKGFAGTGLKFPETSEYEWFPTFDGGSAYYASDPANRSVGNVIEKAVELTGASRGRQVLNDIVMMGKARNNRFGVNCRRMTLGQDCSGNVFQGDSGVYSQDNIFRGLAFGNTFGSGLTANTFGIGMQYNRIGGMMRNNKMRESMIENSIGHYFQNNAVDESFCINNVGDSCINSQFGFDCISNEIGHESHNLYFEHSCHSNRIGKGCHHVSLGEQCECNEVGDLSFNMELRQQSSFNRIRPNCSEIDIAGVYNEIGDICVSVTIYGSENKIGVNCHDILVKTLSSGNRIGPMCEHVVIMNGSISNTIGRKCMNVYIGEICENCEVGNACEDIWFGSLESETLSSNYRNVSIGPECHGLGLVRGNANSSYAVQNITVHKGINGAGDIYIEKKYLDIPLEINLELNINNVLQLRIGTDTRTL